MLSRDSIIAVKDFGIEKIDVPEWGGEVCLKKWSAKERGIYLSMAFNESEVKMDEVANSMVSAVAMSLCDEDGKRLFNDDELDILAGKNGEVIERLCKEVYKLNGLAANSIEESAKN